MYAVRLWSVRHARGLNAFYRGFEGVLLRMNTALPIDRSFLSRVKGGW